eukprot:13839066-Alexandrium_andersonii.AAC.1
MKSNIISLCGVSSDPLDPPQEAPPARPLAGFVGRFGICAKNGADHTPPELRGSVLKQFLGPRSSSLERPKAFRIS